MLRLPLLLTRPGLRSISLLPSSRYMTVHTLGLSNPTFPYTLSSRSFSKKKGKKVKRGIKIVPKEEKEEGEEEDDAAADSKADSEDSAEIKEDTGAKEAKEEAKEDTEGEKEKDTNEEGKGKGKDKDKGKGKEEKETKGKGKEKAKEKEEKDTKEGKEVKEKETKESKTGKKGKKGASEIKSSGNVLEDTIRQIEQAFGKGALMKLTNSENHKVKLDPDEVVPTGSLGLDLALGVGGLPLGRITEVYGPESSGKTTLALHVIAEAQRQGKYCAFIDAEHALNPQWAAKLGVNTDELLISQPDSGEQALEIVDSLIKAGKTNVIVIDSVAALVPKVELEGEMGDTHIGVQARLMSQALRKISPSLTKSKCVLIFINQIRMKIGVMFGNPETTTGGNALKFYSSVRLEIRRIGSVKRGEDIIGNQIRVKVAKNKLAPPFKEALFDIDFGKGISKLGEVIDWGVKSRVLEKMGAWYAYQGTQIGQGREKTKAYLEEHPDVAEEIETAIREKLLKGELTADEESEATDEEKAADEKAE